MIVPLRSEKEVERLVTDNRKLVEYMVNRYLKRFYVGTMEREDLVSWANLGLVKAARTWDPARGTTFATLACRAIERMIIRGVKREWHSEREQATVSLDEFISGIIREGGDDRFVDQMPADADIERSLLDTERQVVLRSALAGLPLEQQQLIKRRYFDDDSVADIARDLGLSRQGVYSREKAIFKQLRERLGDRFSLTA